MSDIDIFGPLVVPTDIGDSVISTLQKWLPDYCGVVERKIGQPTGWLPVPQTFVVTDDQHHFPEEAPPVVVIAIPGTLESPKADGQRNYRAFWDLRVFTFVSTGDRVSTERLAKYYGAVMRLCLSQKGTLGGLAAGTEWIGESYDRRTNDRLERTLGCAEVRFRVDVRQVARALGGPLTPSAAPSQPPADWPVASRVTATFKP